MRVRAGLKEHSTQASAAGGLPILLGLLTARSMRERQLQDLIVTTLVRENGGTARAWRMAVGPIKLYDVATHPHCNWSASPRGTVGENAAIEGVLDDLRGGHPVIMPG